MEIVGQQSIPKPEKAASDSAEQDVSCIAGQALHQGAVGGGVMINAIFARGRTEESELMRNKRLQHFGG